MADSRRTQVAGWPAGRGAAGQSRRRGDVAFDGAPKLARRAADHSSAVLLCGWLRVLVLDADHAAKAQDRKSTRLNSSHANISYAVFCLKKKNNPLQTSATSTIPTISNT